MKRSVTLLFALVLALTACAHKSAVPDPAPVPSPVPVSPSPSPVPAVAPPPTGGPAAPQVPTPDDVATYTPGAYCATSRLGLSFTKGGVTYTCKGPKPYRWRR